MFKTLLMLCFEFFKTGLFSIGGGMATIPFLSEMAVNHPDWFTLENLADMIAVSESTPGPIGINMATYVGYTVGGVPGSLIATFSIVLPSFICIMIIAKFLDKYMENIFVKSVFASLRPAVTGLISAATFVVFKMALFNSGTAFSFDNPFAVFNIPAIIIFLVFFIITQLKYTKKIHPILIIIAGAGAGILFKL